jgi:hypothetical protein
LPERQSYKGKAAQAVDLAPLQLSSQASVR